MHDPDHRRHGGVDFFEQFSDCAPIGDVAGRFMNADLARGQLGQNFLCFVGSCAVPADQYQVARASFDEPFGRFQSEPAEAAGNDMRALGIDPERRIGARHGLQRRRLDDDFADVLGALHQFECLTDVAAAKYAVRQRRQPAGSEQTHQIGVEFLAKLPAIEQDLIDVDAEVTQVVAERPQADLACC